MTETEKLIRDIDTVRESIQLAYVELDRTLAQKSRQDLREQIEFLQADLLPLLEQLWRLEEQDNKE